MNAYTATGGHTERVFTHVFALKAGTNADDFVEARYHHQTVITFKIENERAFVTIGAEGAPAQDAVFNLGTVDALLSAGEDEVEVVVTYFPKAGVSGQFFPVVADVTLVSTGRTFPQVSLPEISINIITANIYIQAAGGAAGMYLPPQLGHARGSLVWGSGSGDSGGTSYCPSPRVSEVSFGSSVASTAEGGQYGAPFVQNVTGSPNPANGLFDQVVGPLADDGSGVSAATVLEKIKFTDT